MSDATSDGRLPFSRNGFVQIPGVFDTHRLAVFEEALIDLYMMQISKIAEYEAFQGGQPLRLRPLSGTLMHWRDLPRERKLVSIIEAMEAKDKAALYQVQKMLPSSLELRDLFHPTFRDLLALLLDTTRGKVLIEGPALFINRPKSDRLLYRWHSEAHYYPKRRRFVNVWMPLFGRKTMLNGAMMIRPGSHKQEWPFVEWQADAQSFRQYEIPAGMLNGPAMACEADPGNVVIFDRNLVHRSGDNLTEDYSFAVVARAWTPEDDPTLSGEMAVTPYGDDVGRSGLVIR